MLKYTEAKITFAEVPDEISLCINISGCPVHCPECHSKHLWSNVGTELSPEVLKRLIEQNNGISCICFMGGDIAPEEVNALANFIRSNYPSLKVAWYSGRDCISLFVNQDNFNYIKLGAYKQALGPLNKPTTNQRLYKVTDGKLVDITHLFWR